MLGKLRQVYLLGMPGCFFPHQAIALPLGHEAVLCPNHQSFHPSLPVIGLSGTVSGDWPEDIYRSFVQRGLSQKGL